MCRAELHRKPGGCRAGVGTAPMGLNASWGTLVCPSSCPELRSLLSLPLPQFPH